MALDAAKESRRKTPPPSTLPQKHFEQVVAAVLPHVNPSYVPLPPIPARNHGNVVKKQDDQQHNSSSRTHDKQNTLSAKEDEDFDEQQEDCKTNSNSSHGAHSNDTNADDWPFGGLPPAARVYGTLKGQLSNRQRAQRKEDQLRSMLRCVFALLPSSASTSEEENDDKDDHDSSSSSCASPLRTFTIVDFGGGSGHLAIPLALLLQQRQDQQQRQQQQDTSVTTTNRPIISYHYRVIVVDLGERSLELLRQKASHCGNDGRRATMTTTTSSDVDVDVDARLRPCQEIPNLYTFHGPVEAFNDIAFDMGIALHLCGEATDVALRKCCGSESNSNTPTGSCQSLIFCPCCVGKLNAQKRNPYVWQATGTNSPSISYPQSQTFQECISRKEDWNALAQAADYSSSSTTSSDIDNENNDSTDNTTTTTAHESRTHSNAIRRTAKSLVETDRVLFLQEQKFQTALTRMIPWEATPKNDIIMAWRTNNNDTKVTSYTTDDDEDQQRGSRDSNTKAITASVTRQPWMDATDMECNADIQRTKDLLLSRSSTFASTDTGADGSGMVVEDSIYWTGQEEMEIRNQLRDYFFTQKKEDNKNATKLERGDDKKKKQEGDERDVLVFPTGMGRRRRKLVHHVAEQMNLAHWCVGRKSSEKTVAVAVRRIPPTRP